ncbi:uncharacterized protein LOC128674047 isoform X2 [Plodia interpunctella]|uniref:uncharacterized protein LOC128674047 isoform X2 n=1 Tax=Plodia interpunctella TaxID=58824 RepID=UPI002367C1EE|nr:uncharacterized protein LOC128674047 isoform X2 [Plodia interpunctella]
MAQCRSNSKLKQSLRGKSLSCSNKEDCLCAVCYNCNLDESNTQVIDFVNHPGGNADKSPNTLRPTSVINLRSSNRAKADQQPLPDVGATGTSPTTHSNMKTKQTKEESDKSIDEDTIIEPKTRARKKASDLNEDDKNKPSQEEPKTSKETKKPVNKPKAVVKKWRLGIRKTLRGKKRIVTKDKIKTIVKQAGKRGRKPAIKPDPDISQDIKLTVSLIPASEIKKEPIEDTASNSRSSSPKTAGRRQRLSSDMIMMKSVLADSPNSLVLGPRTSPYSMRSERSNSPLLADAKNLRSGKPRKVKNNLLNEVVMKEQKKRRRLLSDSKNTDVLESPEDCKKLKRGRSCSRDGSEISKSSDVTESDISLNEPFNDTESKELNKKLDKSKTDLDVDIENNVQISTTEKVPSLNVDSNLAEIRPEAEPSCITNKKNKEKLSLKRSTSLDSDNNNSNRKLSSSEIEEKLLKTDTIFEARSSILTSMSKTFNSKEVSKNIRKARKGRKAMAASRTNSTGSNASPVKACTTSTIANDPSDDKGETIETLSKEIDDLINDLDQHIDQEHDEMSTSTLAENTPEQMQAKTVSKFYGLSKPLGDNNSIVTPDTPIKDKESVTPLTNETTPSKTDDSENIRLHYEDSAEKSTDGTKAEIPFKCKPVVASIDKLMDRLKEFEEFDKKRQRQESESKSSESKPMMVTNDVVLITKSGADIKPLKDIQSVRSPERPIEKENVLSCFENNSAISIVKRDQVRKSTDVDLPNSVTLIKRNSISARKESTSSNHSKESDAISIFEKSLGKDVTLTEIRKSVDKSAPVSQVDLHQFATLQPNQNQGLAGVVIDSNQISILPRMANETKGSNNDIKIISKRKSRESLTNKSTDSTPDVNEEKMAILEKIKSPQHQSSVAILITPAPVAAKSEEMQPVEAEALPPPVVEPKTIPDDTSLTTEIPKTDGIEITNISAVTPKETVAATVLPVNESAKAEEVKVETNKAIVVPPDTTAEKMVVDEKPIQTKDKPETNVAKVVQEVTEKKDEKPSIIPDMLKTPEIAKVVKARSKSARNSIESIPGPSNILHETPESRERKEAVLRTLGLLTHKAAKEAKIEKQKEKERIYNSNKNKSSKAGSGDYTGTLKTVIKLNRGTGERDKKKYRSSLKMTFQKSKHRSGKSAPEGEAADEEGAYYTIEKREGGAGAASDDAEAAPEPVEPKETLNLVIPEKASSFSIHPGRLCMDQCFYCGGKFGLFDTPCHIAQMKSSDRQKKVLDNEEKLTIDSCLCDACYRHVDRRANCPSYRKRPLVKPDAALLQPTAPPATQPEKLPSPPLEEESDEDNTAPSLASGRPATCHTEGCSSVADNSIRRKWLIKMRNSVNKVLKLKCDYPGLHTIPLCAAHYRSLSVLMSCVLCRRVTKHNAHLIHHGFLELNPLLAEAGVPVQFSERPLLCKFCRAYCSLLQRAGPAARLARSYRRKLLQIYNIEVPPGSDNDADEATMVQEEANASFGKQRKKQRTKSKQRKSTEPDKADSESSERTTPHDDGSPEKKEDSNDGQKPITIEQKPTLEQKTEVLEEDIESLISSNKILVPGAVKPPEPTHSDESDVYDFEAPILDKQTELQYLLQKQNNPAQFMQKPANLTLKQRNIMKMQTPGIQKPGNQHRINEKNAKKIHKLGHIIAHKERMNKKEHELQIFDPDKGLPQDGSIPILKNITLNDECTIESIPNKKPADITTLKNKWQMSESFTQVKKNLSELSKKLGTEKEPNPKKSDTKYSNPVKRLETNPSISVRELFPGEEEMNLHCNIDFNNVKGVTPEGWEKCNSTIQYDVETKRLWNELQRPYGNQSSFMRHLILLEKYFRNGDLVLSHNATPHAANYSDSVQSRLRAYDNVVNDTPRRSEPAISLMEFRKKPSINGKSLLKTSHNPDDKDPKKFMPPPPFPKPKPPKADKSKSKALPPELIAINTPNAQGRKAIQNVLQNIQQLVKDVSASDPTEVAAAPLPIPKFDPPKFEPPKFESTKVDTPKADPPKEKRDTPKSDTPKRQKAKSKPWRPTLMPITPENLAKAASEPPQVAVDGRLLPSLVQVKTNQKRYHITLQDYNKMCLIRREKMKLLQDGDSSKSSEETTVVTEIQPSALLGNGGTVVQNISITEDKSQDKKELPELGQIGSNAATILKNVGLKNITIAPIPPKTATVTSQTLPLPAVSSPSLLVTSMPKIPQLGPSVSITSEAVLTPNLPIMSASHMIMPKIPKSLTVIPQTVVSSVPQTAVVTPSMSQMGPAPQEGSRP